jgi:hypothetical protein
MRLTPCTRNPCVSGREAGSVRRARFLRTERKDTHGELSDGSTSASDTPPYAKSATMPATQRAACTFVDTRVTNSRLARLGPGRSDEDASTELPARSSGSYGRRCCIRCVTAAARTRDRESVGGGCAPERFCVRPPRAAAPNGHISLPSLVLHRTPPNLRCLTTYWVQAPVRAPGPRRRRRATTSARTSTARTRPARRLRRRTPLRARTCCRRRRRGRRG